MNALLLALCFCIRQLFVLSLPFSVCPCLGKWNYNKKTSGFEDSDDDDDDEDGNL